MLIFSQTNPTMRTLAYTLPILLLLTACQDMEAPGGKGYADIPAFAPQGINVVVEIPAGTNRKIEYDKATRQFRPDQRGGKDRVIDFLPYPGNYGFIPSTHAPESQGGDGDPLDVLLLSVALPTGTVVAARPIGALQLLDEGQMDTKIIAVPADSSLQTMQPADFADFSIQYDGAKHILETWFLYYDGLGTNTYEGWADEAKAMELVRKWARPAEPSTE